MIITELCQNAVEHGLATHSGEVRVVPTVVDGWLRVEISDDGRGLPEDFDLAHVAQPGPVHRHHAGRRGGGSFTLGPQPDGTRDAGRGRDSDLSGGREGAVDRPPRVLDITSNRYSLWELFASMQRSWDVRTPHRTRLAWPPVWPLPSLSDRPSPWLVPGRPRAPVRRRPRVRAHRRRVQQHQRSRAKHSLRAPVTDENFYFVMADRFANGDPPATPAVSQVVPTSTGSTPPTRASTRAATSRVCWIRSTTSRIWVRPRSGSPRASRTRRCNSRTARPPATTATGLPTSPRSTRTSAPMQSSPLSSTPPMRGG